MMSSARPTPTTGTASFEYTVVSSEAGVLPATAKVTIIIDPVNLGPQPRSSEDSITVVRGGSVHIDLGGYRSFGV